MCHLVTAFSLPLDNDDFLFGNHHTPIAVATPDVSSSSEVLSGTLQLDPSEQTSACESLLARPSMVVSMSSCSNDFWEVGSASVQGARSSMEDAHLVDLDLGNQTAVLGVFDGHGGHQCAQFCASHFTNVLRSTPGWGVGDMKGALHQGFLEMDDELMRAGLPSSAGTTCTVALLRGESVVVAGVGDSRAVMVRNGRLVPMTTDHRPDAPEEEARIRSAGGFVFRGRVNACLNVSRALGDAQFKQDMERAPCQQQVSPEPEVRESNVATARDFLLLCSDGVWNSLKECAVLRFVRSKLSGGAPPAQVAADLCRLCLEPTVSAYDNVTVILCTFTPAAVGSGRQRRSIDNSQLPASRSGSAAQALTTPAAVSIGYA